MSTTRRILHLRTVSGTGGGPDKTIMNACRWLNDRGHVAEVFYILDHRHHPGTIESLAEKHGVRFYSVTESSPVSLKTLFALRRTLVAGHYDILQTHDYKANVLARLLQRCGGYRIVATAHGYNQTTWRESLYYAIERRLFRRIDGVVAPTRQMRRFLLSKGVPRQRITVIPNGVIPFTIQRSHRNRPTLRVLYLGRLSREKNPLLAVDAINILRHTMPNVELILAGDGPERSAVVNHIRQLNLQACVVMPGHVADPHCWLADADVLICPSRTECMPNAILEAMMARVPVVATAVGGVPEMIRHGIEGLLCQQHDANTLADAIFSVLSNPTLAKELSDSAYRRVMTCFTFDARMHRMEELHDRVILADGNKCATSSNHWVCSTQPTTVTRTVD